jgi:hypothetical protein
VERKPADSNSESKRTVRVQRRRRTERTSTEGREKVMDLDASGNIAQVSAQEGGTLTFRDRMFTWEELDAARGAYIVGFIVEDLDGNQYTEYTQVAVE